MDFGQAAAELERRADLLERRAPEVLERSLEILQEAAEAHSRGPLQAEDLARMGHPYSRARPRLNPNIVNTWTGDFLEGWEREIDRGGLSGSVFQTDPKAAAMERGLVFGRKVMVERHPEEDALEDAAPVIAGLVEQMLDDVFG